MRIKTTTGGRNRIFAAALQFLRPTPLEENLGFSNASRLMSRGQIDSRAFSARFDGDGVMDGFEVDVWRFEPVIVRRTREQSSPFFSLPAPGQRTKWHANKRVSSFGAIRSIY